MQISLNFKNPKTLEAAQKELEAKLMDGTRCPCCSQWAQKYRRTIYAGMAASLILLYKINRDGKFVHKTEMLKHSKKLSTTLGGGDFAKLKFWDLIEEMSGTTEDKRTSGYWRITEKGVGFVEGKVFIQSHVILYDGKPLGFEGELISIESCLGTKFSYQELMGWAA